MSTFARAQISRTRSAPTQVVTINRDTVVIKKIKDGEERKKEIEEDMNKGGDGGGGGR
jgi:hypothetical protein